ncbi:DUF4118 domain-containing protein [Thiorhodococcus mannitoliphagus]|uniref:histidine kinase n=1 Tax=Thiorhodococcus mannitoliphagus TaxID=329406 RepID=A0A6P1DZ26_9GAMM|nr:DUF4118 domain-containing protein [Thiorhodococcus mannitoliphagus]NEX20964.1 DUF4118 domain-containing protein [Thiorhodococcus mannitoliphagus]
MDQASYPRPASDYLLAAAVVLAALTLALLVRPWLPLANLSLVFLIGVLWVSVRTGPLPALFTALLSALTYNFFLTEPHYSLLIQHTDELLTVGFFLLVGLIGGQVAARLRRQMLALRVANDQARVLLDLGRRLAGLSNLVEVQRETVRMLSEHMRLAVVLFAPGEEGQPLILAAHSEPEPSLDDRIRQSADWAFAHRRPCGLQTTTQAELDWRLLPLGLEEECFGVVGISYCGQAQPTTTELTALDGLIAHATLAMARTRLTDHLQQARLGEETERLRAALLSSVSHDLRTPLASMIGAASSLRALDRQLSAEDRDELLEAVLSEGERLDRYIQNLLDMTRLGHGTLKLERDWIGIDDILGAVLRRLRDALRSHRVIRVIEPDLPLLYVHPALIEQALINLLENAAKFSPSDSEIRLTANREDDALRVSVSDQGAGIAEAERARIFDMFYTGRDGDRGKHGSGLGLAICSGMIGAHGGRIEVMDGLDGRGTTFVVHLPLIEAPVKPESGT